MISQGEKSEYGDSWTTPKDIVEWIENKFGKIDLDIAASDENALAKRYFTKENSALKNDWKCSNGFFNPPFSMCEEFCLEAYRQVFILGNACRVIGLMPLNVVGNAYWRNIEPEISYRIELAPRVQYIPHPLNPKKGNAANGPSMLVVWMKGHSSGRISWEWWKHENISVDY